MIINDITQNLKYLRQKEWAIRHRLHMIGKWESTQGCSESGKVGN